jgi:hypothetical protein
MGLGKLATFVLVAGSSLTTFGADFNEIIRNPEKFHNKRVTLVAMVEGGGAERFYLYQPPEPKSPGDDAREIYGLILQESPLYERYNKKLVKVTGVIDASYRGLFSENACGLIIERVRLAGKVEKPKLSCRGASCLEVKFSQLLKNPKSYEHKCVCVTGFAHVRGDAFAIYESEKAAGGKDPDFTKGIFVSRASDTADYDRYNKRWIKIRGVVDLEQRGFADYPAGVVAEQVEPASPRK